MTRHGGYFGAPWHCLNFLPELQGHGSYVQPLSELANAIEGEFDGVEPGEGITLHLNRIQMTVEEYQKLPEFTGH